MNKIIVDLYADGGVIDKNPSPIGGTWAWALVNLKDELRARGSGVIKPKEIGPDAVTVTNNQTELLSILLGLNMVECRGLALRYVYSDSKITLGRVFEGHALNNVPLWMVELKRNLLPVLKGAKGIWVRGHNGNKWNEYVDAAARKAGEVILFERDPGKHPDVVIFDDIHELLAQEEMLTQDLGRSQENLRKIK